MHSKPLVSVLMPVYNAEHYILESVNSILTQRYSFLELIIVDDGCTDASIEKVLALNNERIKVIKNQSNIGLAASLNIAIMNASGTYLARMDADDISSPERIEQQVKTLEANHDISVLGTGLQYFGFSSYKNYFPQDHQRCKAKLLFNVCFGHPSVVFRREVFDKPENFYNPALRQYSEDYDLYARLVDHCQFANLPRLYVQYRTFRPVDKTDAESKRKNNSTAVRNRMLAGLGIIPTAEEQEIHRMASDLSSQLNQEKFKETLNWLNYLCEKNRHAAYFDQEALESTVAEQAFLLYYHNLKTDIAALRQYSFFKKYKMPAYLWAKSQVKRALALFNS